MVDDAAGNPLRTTLGLMAASMEAIADAVVWVDSDHQVQWCNSVFERLVQQSHSEVIGSALRERLTLMQAGQPIEPQAYPDEQVRQGQYATTEYDAQLGDRTLTLEISGNLVPMPDNSSVVILVIRDITRTQQLKSEHQQRAIALQQAEAKYQAIFENATQGIYQSTPEGRFFSANPAFARIMGYESPEELIQTLIDIGRQFYAQPERRREVLEILHHQGFIANIESQIFRKDGSVIWISESARVVCDEMGHPLYYEGFVEDITERKKAEDEREELLSILRATLEATSEGILVVNRDRNVPVYNQKFLQMWSVPGALMLPERGDERLQFLADQTVDPDEFKAGVWDLFLNHPEAETFDLVNMKDGRVFERYSQPQWIGDQIVGRVWGFRDMTAHKQAEAALKASETELRTLFGAMDDVILVFDREGRCLKVAPTKTNKFFKSPAENLNKTVHEVLPKEQADLQLSYIHQALDTQQTVAVEYSLMLTDGEHWFDASVAPLSQTTVIWVARDISDRKRLEQKLLQSQQLLDNIIDNIPLAIFVKDVVNDFRYVLINKVSEKVLGFAKEGAIGLNDYDLLPAERANGYRHQDTSVVMQRSVVEFPEQWIGTPNERMLVRGWKLPLFDPQGNITHLVAITEDVTERKQREQALRLIFEGTASKTGVEFFRTCMRYLAEVLQVRYALVTEIVNEARTRVRTLADWGDITTNENREYDLRGTPTEQVVSGEVFYCPRGLRTRFPHDTHLHEIGAESYLGVPLSDSSGAVLGHLAVMDDKPMALDPGRELILKIFAARTAAELERKQAEEALEQRAQIDSLLSSISRQFIDQDVNTAINFALRAIAQLINAERSCIFEFSDDQHYIYLVNEWCTEGIPPLSTDARATNADAFPELFTHIIRGHSLQLPSIERLTPGMAEKILFERESIQSVAIVPMIHRNKVVGFIGSDVVTRCKTWSQRDVNLLRLVGELIAIGRARHKAEDALRVAKEAAEAANRAKSVFLANMSHELRTPLNAILGFSQLMERDTALTLRQRESLATINRSGEHLLELINDVLEMSKIEAGRTVLNPAPFDLHRLLQTLYDMFQIRAQAKHLALQFDWSNDLPRYVVTDEGKLRQVLINLLGNAVKFTQAGGVILRVHSVDPSRQQGQREEGRGKEDKADGEDRGDGEGGEDRGDGEGGEDREAKHTPTPHTLHPTPLSQHPTPNTQHLYPFTSKSKIPDAALHRTRWIICFNPLCKP